MWITQELKVGPASFHLFEWHVAIEELIGDCDSRSVILYPTTRDEAIRMSVCLRLASKRLEEVSKGLE